ncbi:daptide-type RiPP [Kitasatospora sp. NPDC101155]|uniref:daptide-type RiPP n=1 Tax=Kitasatospora sp. NPDC101155 TaxID=3364097 RepID=UPI00381B1B18
MEKFAVATNEQPGAELNLRFEELELMDAPDAWSWYAGVKVGIVLGLGAAAIT